jgi:hypothetical protein
MGKGEREPYLVMSLVTNASGREPAPIAIATTHSIQFCGRTLKIPGKPCIKATCTTRGMQGHFAVHETIQDEMVVGVHAWTATTNIQMYMKMRLFKSPWNTLYSSSTLRALIWLNICKELRR